MGADELLQAIHQAVLDGEEDEGARLAAAWLEAGLDPLQAIDEGFTPGIAEAGQLFEDGDFFLPELVTAARAVQAGLAVLEPRLVDRAKRSVRGRVVIGTVQGDIHEIGKTLVATLLSAAGFEVDDLGVDVQVETFVTRAREIDADLVGASALLTTTMPVQRQLVAALREAGLRAKVIVGGAPVDGAWARSIGADGHAENAAAAVELALSLVGPAAEVGA
jgi:corrinoid protein of di/trimethylamine methyltransferase